MKSLSSYLKDIHFYPDDLKDAVLSIVKPEFYKKNTPLFKPGRICPYIWYLETGLIRIYEHCGDKEITPWLLDAPAIIIAPDSSLDGIKPTRMWIEAIEPCITQRALIQDVHRVIHDHPGFAEHYRIINANYRRMQNEREADLRALDAEQRFFKVLKESPSFFRRVKKEILCQYIDVSPNKFTEYKNKYMLIRK